MKTITKYQCEVCHKIWSSQIIATLCEAYQIPPTTVKIGDEVKLRNRGGRTYTVAIIKDISIVSSSWINDSEEIRDKRDIEHYSKFPFHRYEFHLDRDVMLDRKWEEPLSYVYDYYLVGEDEAMKMTRDDNNCG